MWIRRTIKKTDIFYHKTEIFDHKIKNVYPVFKPFDNRTHLDHLNTRLVQYSDGYCKREFCKYWQDINFAPNNTDCTCELTRAEICICTCELTLIEKFAPIPQNLHM